MPVLLHLYDTWERLRLAERAATTDDRLAVTGSFSKEHHEAVRQRIDALEKLAAGEPLDPATGYTRDTPERIEL